MHTSSINPSLWCCIVALDSEKTGVGVIVAGGRVDCLTGVGPPGVEVVVEEFGREGGGVLALRIEVTTFFPVSAKISGSILFLDYTVRIAKKNTLHDPQRNAIRNRLAVIPFL